MTQLIPTRSPDYDTGKGQIQVKHDLLDIDLPG